MRTIKFGVFLFCFAMLCANCAKKQKSYPEDPKSSRITPDKRLSGTWKIATYTYKGKDIIPQLNVFTKNTVDFKRDVYLNHFYDETYKSWRTRMYCFSKSGVNFDSYPKFDEETLTLSSDQNFKKPDVFQYCFVYPLSADTFVSLDSKWLVTKLYDKELHLVLKTDSGNFNLNMVGN